MTVFDIESISEDWGIYQPQDDTVTIYLAAMYFQFCKDHSVTWDLLHAQIVDVIIHESIHQAIDYCLEGKPQTIDDHKIFKYLVS